MVLALLDGFFYCWGWFCGLSCLLDVVLGCFGCVMFGSFGRSCELVLCLGVVRFI